MGPRYKRITQTSNQVLNNLKKLEGFASELENLIGTGSAADGITAVDVANYLTKLGVEGRSKLDLVDLSTPDMINVVNKTLFSNKTALTTDDVAAYLARSSRIQDDHARFLNKSAVSLDQVKHLTSMFTEFKKIEFNLPVTPAPLVSLLSPPVVNSGYIQVRDSELITTNALTSMYNKGIIENSFTVNYINAPDDNGFVKNVDNTLSGTSELSNLIGPSHLMSAKPNSDFKLSLSFKIDNTQTKHSEFFMYDIVANTSDEASGIAYGGKYLDLSSVISVDAYEGKYLNQHALVALDSTKIAAGVFYDIEIIKTGTVINFKVTDENNSFVGSGSDTVPSGSIYWGLFNNKNVTLKSIVLEGVSFYVGSGLSKTDDNNPFEYKIQSTSNDNKVIISYFTNIGSIVEVMEINGPLITSKFRTRPGDGDNFFVSDNAEYILMKTDLGQYVIYDPESTLGDGTLFQTSQLDLTQKIKDIEALVAGSNYWINSLHVSSPTNDKTSIYINGFLEVVGTDYIGSCIFEIVIDNTDPDNVVITSTPVSSAMIETVVWPTGYSVDITIQGTISQSVRNKRSNGDGHWYLFTGLVDGNLNIFIMNNEKILGNIPILDKVGNPAPVTVNINGEILQSSEVILLGSQFMFVDGTWYLFVSYGLDTKGAPFDAPYNNIVRSNNYQRLARINIDSVINKQALTGLPVTLGLDSIDISYFVNEVDNSSYISPMSSYPYGQHINVESKAMVVMNRQNYFGNKMTLYELDIDNLKIKNPVDYQTKVASPIAGVDAAPFRATISKEYVFMLIDNSTYAINLKSSFSKGASKSAVNKLVPVTYLESSPEFDLDTVRNSVLDPLPVPYWFSFDTIIPLEDLNATTENFNNALAISATIGGQLIVNGETFTYDFDEDQYVSVTDPTKYYTLSVETGNTLAYNALIDIPSRFKVMTASLALGGKKWLAFREMDPNWAYQKYAIDANNGFTSSVFSDLSQEVQVDAVNSPNLYYLSLAQAIYISTDPFLGSDGIAKVISFSILIILPVNP